MTTIKGFMRSTTASINRMQRAQQRHARETARQFQIQQKEQTIADAGTAVTQYNNYVGVLKSLHKEVADPVDWSAILAEPAPTPPQLSTTLEAQEVSRLKNYKPSFLDKAFGSTKKKQDRLEKNIQEAKQKDQLRFEQEKEAYTKAYEEWKFVNTIAQKVINRDKNGYGDALQHFEPFDEIKALGSGLNFTIEPNYMVADLQVNSDEVIPKYTLSQTSTGKLSKKDMPVTKFNELYQDHICSSILRIARESLAFLPLQFIIVNAWSNILNTANGKMEPQVIVSALIYPESLENINFDTIDPSDSMRNFLHNMKFSKVNGFSIVSAIKPEEVKK